MCLCSGGRVCVHAFDGSQLYLVYLLVYKFIANEKSRKKAKCEIKIV